MEYDKKTDIITVNSKDDLYMTRHLFHASRLQLDPRDKSVHPPRSQVELPHRLGATSSDGLKEIIEKAVQGKLKVSRRVLELAKTALLSFSEPTES